MINKHRTVQVKDLNKNLICVLCNGYLIDATTITNCLHSFCRSCIRKYLSQNPVCPGCIIDDPNHKQQSSPKLKLDRILQALVYKMVPGLYQRELSQRVKYAEDHPDQRQLILRTSEDPPPSERSCVISSGFSKEEQFSICLKRQICVPVQKGDASADIQTFLLCPNRISLAQLKKFVLYKLGLLDDWQVIFFHEAESYPDRCTLIDIAFIKEWDKSSPLVLDYILINPRLKGSQLCNSSVVRKSHLKTIKRQQTLSVLSRSTSNALLNNSVRITESSPTSGIKITIRLPESMRQDKNHNNVNREDSTERHDTVDLPPVQLPPISTPPQVAQREFKTEIATPDHVHTSTLPLSSGKNNKKKTPAIAKLSDDDEDDFQLPLPKKPRLCSPEHVTSSNNNNNTNNNFSNKKVNKDGSSGNGSVGGAQAEVSHGLAVPKKKKGRARKSTNRYGTLSISSLLKRHSEHQTIKNEPLNSPEKFDGESSVSRQEENEKLLQEVIKKEQLSFNSSSHFSQLETSDRLNASSSGKVDRYADGNTSIVTFREDDGDASVQPMLGIPAEQNRGLEIQQEPLNTDNSLVVPLDAECTNAFNVNVLETDVFPKTPTVFLGNGVNNLETCNTQMKVPDSFLNSNQPIDFQKLLMLALQPNSPLQNPELLASVSQKLAELASFQKSLEQQKEIYAAQQQQQQQQQIHLGGNGIDGNVGGGQYLGSVPEMFSGNKQNPIPDYLTSTLVNQQMAPMLLSYPQYQPLVIPPGFECNYVSNFVAPTHQKPVMEATPQDHISSLTIPIPCNVVYPPTQIVPDCAGYYVGLLPQQATQLFQNVSQNFEGQGEVNGSYVTDEGRESMSLTDHGEMINGCPIPERPLFSPMSLDDEDKRSGSLIPESALDPSKEVCMMDRRDSLSNGSHGSGLNSLDASV